MSNPRNIKKTVPKRKKSYKCTLCQLSFPKQSDLKKHSASDHAGIKPHKCLSNERNHSSDDQDYGNTGCRVFKWGVQNWKDFCLKIPKEIIEF